MSTGRYISASDLAWWLMEDFAIDITGGAVDMHPKFVRWLMQANMEMGVPISYVHKYIEAIPQDCIVEKPCDFVKLKALYVGDCSIIPMFEPVQKKTYTKEDRDWCPNFNPKHYCENYVVEELEDMFVTSSNIGDRALHIEYISNRMGKDDYPVLDMDYREAYEAYCKWKYVQRLRAMGMNTNFAAASTEAMAREEYRQASRSSRARVVRDSINQDMLNQVMAAFNDPNYVNQNPYYRNIVNQNTLFANKGMLWFSSRNYPGMVTPAASPRLR